MQTHIFEELFIEDDPARAGEITQSIINGHFKFCNPFLWSIAFESLRQQRNTIRSGHFLWFESVGQRWLIHYDVDSETRCWVGQKGFRSWLSSFNPQSCTDWLLIPRLYSQVVSMGEPDWDGIRARQGDAEKMVLETSRGLLAWEFQYRFLLNLADGGLERSQIDTLIREYRRGKVTAGEQLDELTLGKRSLRAIFDDHRQYFLGTPDYWASGMISRISSGYS